MTGRVPTKVIVKDGIEMILEVDALGEAIGADKDIVTAALDKGCDTRLPVTRRQKARDRLDTDFTRKLISQVLRHVIRRIDETAE
jgi:hypothetical protein